MDRRRFLQKVLSGVAVTASGLVLVGCERKGLVREPVSPYFGPRRGGPTAYARASGGGRPSQTVSRSPTGSVDGGGWTPPRAERGWQYVILHHSATDRGSAPVFDRMHRAHGWDELGYHFVIGNGTESGDGQIEVGSRWPKQKHGAHCKVVGHPEYNDVGIGVCLVGNFDHYEPTGDQVASCIRVVQFLKDRYNIPESRIYGHGQLKPTHCPGAMFPYDTVFRGLT